MTAICTHMGCTVAFSASVHDFECPCHMSSYSFNGAVTAPPAMLPLQHFACALRPERQRHRFARRAGRRFDPPDDARLKRMYTSDRS